MKSHPSDNPQFAHLIGNIKSVRILETWIKTDILKAEPSSKECSKL